MQTGNCRYDWPAQRNLNLIHKQQAGSLWDIEYGNRTSYYFDREANTCRTMRFEVGILTQDWLKGAEYLGQQEVDTHLCNVWLKGPRKFITYFTLATGPGLMTLTTSSTLDSKILQEAQRVWPSWKAQSIQDDAGL